MKVLLTSDLHNVGRWYGWLLSQSPRFDLIAIAGDMFDMFAPCGLLPQILAFDGFVQRLRANGCALAFCTGNHDHTEVWDAERVLQVLRASDIAQARATEILAATAWYDAFAFPGGRMPAVVAANKVSILTFSNGERLLVSTHPFAFDEDFADWSEKLWGQAAALRAKEKTPWLALHHEPVAETKVGGFDGSYHLRHLVEEAHPDYVASGHLHRRPYARNGDWADRLGPAWCFNAGTSDPRTAHAPNHIIIDTGCNSATWVASHDILTAAKVESIKLNNEFSQEKQ